MYRITVLKFKRRWITAASYSLYKYMAFKLAWWTLRRLCAGVNF